MERKFLVFFGLMTILILTSFGCTQNNGTQIKEEPVEGKESMTAEIGFEMKSGKMLMVNEKTKTEAAMEKEAILNDGTKVMTNGKVTRKDGSTFTLKEGESI